MPECTWACQVEAAGAGQFVAEQPWVVALGKAWGLSSLGGLQPSPEASVPCRMGLLITGLCVLVGSREKGVGRPALPQATHPRTWLWPKHPWILTPS